MPGRALLLVAVLVALASLTEAATVCNVTGELPCFHGNLTCGADSLEHCGCQTGYKGVTCGLCADSTVCEVGVPCQPSFTVGQQLDHTLECTVTDPFTAAELGGGLVAFICDGPTGRCSLEVFKTASGSPRIFSCAFSGCTQSYAQRNTLTTCTRTECSCSATCSTNLRAILTNMQTVANVDCDRFSGQCFISQAELSLVVQAQCDAHQCAIVSVPKVVDPQVVIGLSFSGMYLGLVALGYCSNTVVVRRVRNIISQSRLVSNAALLTTAPFWAPASLLVKDLTFAVNGKRALTSVSAVFESGSLTAIIGPSGAGKTTLLDLLANRRSTGIRERGAIVLNGTAVEVVPAYNTSRCGYVLQDDHVHGALTVREHLVVAAELRMPPGTALHERVSRVAQVLVQVGLADEADNFVGDATFRGISGGQRKRLSIATELISAPQILLVDEPTSSLDSAAALAIVHALRGIAKSSNTAVVCTVHQPRTAIFDLFDSVLVLGNHGTAVYFGPTRGLAAALEAAGAPVPPLVTVSDHAMDVVTTQPAVRDAMVKANAANLGRSLRPRRGRTPTAALVESPEEAAAVAAARASDVHDEQQLSRVRLVLGAKPLDTVGLVPVGTRSGEATAAASAAAGACSGSDDGSGVGAMGGGGGGAEPASSDHETYDDDIEMGSVGSAIGDAERGDVPAEAERIKDVGFLRQVATLAFRDSVLLLRARALLRVHLLVAVLAGFVLGIVYLGIRNDLSGVQDRAGSFFFILALLSFSGLSAIDTFQRERVIFVRERGNGTYHPFAYYLSKVLFDVVPLRAVPPLLLTTIVYFMIGYRDTEAVYVFNFLLVLVLVSTAAGALCYLISVLATSAGTASLLAVLVLLAEMLFGGFLVSITRMPSFVAWLHHLSFFKYGFEALMVNEMANTVVVFNPRGFTPILLNGNVILDNYGLETDSFPRNVGVLGAMCAVLLAVVYFVLFTRVKEAR